MNTLPERPALSLIKLFRNEKWWRLAICIAIDLVGNITYFLPVVGESFDLPFAPLTGVILSAMFMKYGKLRGFGAGLANVIEELIPFTDIVPSATIMWFITYVVSEKSTFGKFREIFEKKN